MRGGYRETLQALAVCNASLALLLPLMMSIVPAARWLPGLIHIGDKALVKSFELQKIAHSGWGDVRLVS